MMRAKVLILAAATLCISAAPALAAGKYLYCDTNSRAYIVNPYSDEVIEFADAGRCTNGPWGVTLTLIAPGDTTTTPTDLTAEANANANRARAVLAKLRPHTVHWGRVPKQQTGVFKAHQVEGALAIRADQLPSSVAIQVWPESAK